MPRRGERRESLEIDDMRKYCPRPAGASARCREDVVVVVPIAAAAGAAVRGEVRIAERGDKGKSSLNHCK